jgi:hypothetical protein
MAKLPIPQERITNVTLRVANDAGERLRGKFADILDREVTKIHKSPTRANLRSAANVGAVVEPLARTAKIVHGWGDGSGSGLVVFGAMDKADPEVNTHPVIDVRPPQEIKLDKVQENPLDTP